MPKIQANRTASGTTQQFVDLPLNVFDTDIVPELLEVPDRILAFAQEIWVCFNVDKYEMISDTKSGNLTLESIIFSRTISSQALENRVKSEIDNNTGGSAEFLYEVDVKFIQASIRDIVVIDITIRDTNDRSFKQRFLFE